MRHRERGASLILRRLCTPSLPVLTALTLSDPALSQVIRVGAEFQVNTYTTDAQRVPAVAADAEGDFVVVWASDLQDGSDYGIFGQRFASDGDPEGAEFQVNTYTAGDQWWPAVAAALDGAFMVVWQSDLQDGSDYGVFGQRFASDGDPEGGEFLVNSFLTSRQNSPAVVAAQDDFVAVWASQRLLDPNARDGIFGQRYASDGSVHGGEFQVNTYTAAVFYDPAVTADSKGDFVVVWHNYPQDGGAFGVFGQRFASDGSPLAGEFRVNDVTSSNQWLASVATTANDGFVVVWSSNLQDGSHDGMFGRRFASDGSRIGEEFQINTHTALWQRYGQVASVAGGGFVVTWQSISQDGHLQGVFGQRFSSDGTPVGDEFQVNAYTTDSQSSPAVAGFASGDIVVTWESWFQDGSDPGIFGQRFGTSVPTGTPTDTPVPPTATDTPTTTPTGTPTPTPTGTPTPIATATPTLTVTATPTATVTTLPTADIDGDGEVKALTDGLLLLRYSFGFRGSALTVGVVDANCTRCSSEEIEAALAANIDQFDIDGDGEVGALTDGLLLLRYLFGFRGLVLTVGVVDPDCTRCTSEQIEAYIETLV